MKIAGKIAEKSKEAKRGVKTRKRGQKKQRDNIPNDTAGEEPSRVRDAPPHEAIATCLGDSSDVIELSDSSPPSSPYLVTPRKDFVASSMQAAGPSRITPSGKVKAQTGSKWSPIVLDDDADVEEWGDDWSLWGRRTTARSSKHVVASDVIELTDSE